MGSPLCVCVFGFLFCLFFVVVVFFGFFLHSPAISLGFTTFG